MKIHLLRHGASFHPSVSSQKAKDVGELAALSHKTAAYTRDIISYMLAVNIVNRRDVFCVLYYIVNFIIRASYNLDK